MVHETVQVYSWLTELIFISEAISWTLYNLARFPEHQQKCRDEVDAVMTDKEELEW